MLCCELCNRHSGSGASARTHFHMYLDTYVRSLSHSRSTWMLARLCYYLCHPFSVFELTGGFDDAVRIATEEWGSFLGGRGECSVQY